MRDRSRHTPRHDAARGPAARRARRRPLVMAASLCAALAAIGGLAACQSDNAAVRTPPPSHAPAPSSHSAPAAPKASVAIAPADAVTGVPLDQPVTVTATSGTLTSVTVTDANGDALAGQLAASGATWTSSAPLAATTTYGVRATAVNADGVPTTVASSFTTLTPTKILGTKIAPLEDETVGVGMPIVIYFTAPVTDRATVERHLSVDASIPVVGAWHWMSDTEVHYRPKDYWPVGDKVTVSANVDGVDAGKGVWGDKDHVAHFQVGDSHITSVDAKTDVMTVRVNGKVVKTAPVSLGRDKYPTTSGIHVVLAKQPKVIMDSATVGIPKGDPDYYYETVLWDVRISWSGEFVHSAPWSVADQGHDNVSHGCVNAAPDVAEWFYNLSQRGDIVEIKDTPRPLEPGNGWTDWNMSWSDWLKGSALATPDQIAAAQQAENAPTVPTAPATTAPATGAASPTATASSPLTTTPGPTPTTSPTATPTSAKPTATATSSSGSAKPSGSATP